VIGLLASKGQSSMGRDQDDAIIMPLRTVQRRLTGSQVTHHHHGLGEERCIDLRAMEQIKSLMRERRRSAKEDDDFNVMDTRQIAETLTSTTRILRCCSGWPLRASWWAASAS
jgi:putative ABC transport system permease protein